MTRSRRSVGLRLELSGSSELTDRDLRCLPAFFRCWIYINHGKNFCLLWCNSERKSLGTDGRGHLCIWTKGRHMDAWRRKLHTSNVNSWLGVWIIANIKHLPIRSTTAAKWRVMIWFSWWLVDLSIWHRWLLACYFSVWGFLFPLH